jgi:hypothetical protein
MLNPAHNCGCPTILTDNRKELVRRLIVMFVRPYGFSFVRISYLIRLVEIYIYMIVLGLTLKRRTNQINMFLCFAM